MPTLTQMKKAEIALAVWNGEVNQIQTAEVAKRFGVSTSQALKVLQAIDTGNYSTEEAPFVRAFRESAGIDAVLLKDGSAWSWGDDPDLAQGKRRTQHYVWFTL